MSIVEFDVPPSWSLDAKETAESTKCPWAGVVDGTAGGKKNYFLYFFRLYAINPASRTYGHFVVSPVSLVSRDQDGGQWNSLIENYRSHGKLEDCEQSTELCDIMLRYNLSRLTMYANASNIALNAKA